ncbi:MAG TPA: DUF2889 domain-containing protein [Deltaproteobacteria bacterium]|nr:MAG: hypothetical protein DRG37_01870 [Deltaproteobacteria bacterium]HDM32410.1 DUF2889 domain-containing protein [Deltaproteobacteria bacterium]
MADNRREKIHTRNISISTYDMGDDTVMVEGILRDERLRPTYSLTANETFQPGIIHDLKISLTVRGKDLVIEDVNVEMMEVPSKECKKTRESLRPLIGHRIASGFTLWVKNTFGGPRGCTHLNALLLAMAPAVVQGYWVLKASKPISLGSMGDLPDASYLVDTCWVWRKDGPLVKKMADMLQEMEGK